jgi:light-regulated signal transduction histidine kinase (bacteriophytochrome)
VGQLFQNLVGNAIKFRAERPLEIRVGAQKRAGEWQIFVRDNGIGIDPEHRGRIFDIFHRLHSRDEFDGTGIGLAICKRIVERHGGRIWNEPSPGQGTTFFFTLPRARTPTEEASPAPTPALEDAAATPEHAATPEEAATSETATSDDEGAQADEESSLASR